VEDDAPSMSGVESDKLEAFAARFQEIEAEIAKVILGQEDVVRQALVALIAGGHLLLEGPPGIGKTLLARTLSRTLGVTFRRVQFTPDLMPSDVTGGNVYNQHTNTFEFVAGPIFTQVLLADEINRAPAKTQAALLEAMSDRQVSVDGVTRRLARPFFTMATQNPIESEGTYPLPEAQLDRFMMKVLVGHPPKQVEVALLRAYLRGFDPADLDRAGVREIATGEDLVRMSALARRIDARDAVLDYVAEIVSRTRVHPAVALGASPRASIALLLCAQVVAASERRAYLVPDDVKQLCRPVLRHRFMLHPDAELDGTSADDVVDEILQDVKVPGGETG
jgi:MoxR-like ATPase